ncbi:MAG TPA: glycosyltransferase family 4 protein [Flavisolibacter sp.]|nr:glycosyltransferase family 4 protein [Flavisolibacter sp.]
MKSICFISLMNGDPWGGSEELWYQAALYALKENYKVDCIVYDDPKKKQKLQPLHAAGATIYYLANKGKYKRNISEKIQFKISKKIHIPALLRKIDFHQYYHTVVSQGEFETTLSVWKNFWRRLGSYSLLFHNYKEDQKLGPETIVRLKNWTQHATHNLFASRRIYQVLDRVMQTKIPNADVLINPITFPSPAAPKPWPPLQDGEYIFVVLAALEVKRKAQDSLIIALSADQWRSRNWKLHLYGGGIDKQKLEALIKEKGLEHRVILKGHTSEVEKVLTEAHLICQMSFIDAMPISVVEGMACARPVLVSKIGDMPWWVDEGRNGFISADASVEEVAKTLEKAWEVRDGWEAMGKESFALFKEKFPPLPEKYFLTQIEK